MNAIPALIAKANDLAEATAPDRSTFTPGLRQLPHGLRQDVYRLYGILRTLDDLVDEDHSDASERIEAVETWTRTRDSPTPETRALSWLDERHDLPTQALLEFCAGMRHDIDRVAVHTEEDLELYCQRVGGSVGVMLAHLLGTRSPEGAVQMATLGRAVQRTNIVRDIDEDASHGRRYISNSTIEHFGPPLPGRRSELIRDQIARADALYEEASNATSLLACGRRGMALCTALYREILRQVERDGYGRRTGRAVVPLWRRYLLIARHRVSPCHR